jgi:hypothetical protein
MTWGEFVEDWTKKKYDVEGLLLSEELTDAEEKAILAMFPTTEDYKLNKDAAKSIDISVSKLKQDCGRVYEKLDFLGDNKKKRLRDALMQGFKAWLLLKIVPKSRSHQPYEISSVDSEDEQNQLRKNLQIGQAIYQSLIIFASAKDLINIEIDNALNNESSILNLLRQKLSLDFNNSFILNEIMFYNELLLLEERAKINLNIYRGTRLF